MMNAWGCCRETLDLIVLRTLGEPGAAARLCDCDAAPTSIGRFAASQPGHALSRAGAAGAAGADQRNLGQDREQSRGEVLRHYESRRKGARRGDAALAADVRSGGKTAFRRSVSHAAISIETREFIPRRARRERVGRRDGAETHLALLQEDFERQGLTPEKARLAAKREYGGIEQAKELHRSERSLKRVDRRSSSRTFATAGSICCAIRDSCWWRSSRWRWASA